MIIWIYSEQFNKPITECKIESTDDSKQKNKSDKENNLKEYEKNFFKQVWKYKSNFQTYNHYKDISTKDLKNLLSKLETDNIDKEFYITEIESVLEDMKPIKCDFASGLFVIETEE